MRMLPNEQIYYSGIMLMVFSLFVCNIYTAEFSFGVKAGMCAAGFWGDDADEMEDLTGQSEGDSWRARLGFCGGGFLSVFVNEIFGVQSECIIAMKGRRFSIDVAGVETISTIKLNYLEVPVLAVARFPVSDVVVPFCYAGTAFDALMTAKSHVKIDYPPNLEDMGFTDTDDTRDIRDDISKADLGFLFGGGVRLPLSSGALLFDVRYCLGLIEIDEDGDSDTKNHAFNFTVGYEF